MSKRATLTISPAAIPEVLIVTCRSVGDERGDFSEVFSASAFAAFGVTHAWAQENQVLTRRRNTLRGLHFQTPPHAQAKLVRVLRGAIYDVAVDVRRGSPTYGKHVGVELNAANGSQLYVPVGFAHGYLTLTDETEVLYKVGAHFDEGTQGGIAWDDPDLGIAWPIAGETHLNQRDREWPAFRNFTSRF